MAGKDLNFDGSIVNEMDLKKRVELFKIARTSKT